MIVTMRPTELERAWAAGFFDGEGCFSIGGISPTGHRRVRVTVSQKDPEVLRKFADIVGMGNVAGPHETKTSVVYQWSKGGINEVREIALILWPYLGTVKRQQANRVIQEYKKNERRNLI